MSLPPPTGLALGPEVSLSGATRSQAAGLRASALSFYSRRSKRRWKTYQARASRSETHLRPQVYSSAADIGQLRLSSRASARPDQSPTRATLPRRSCTADSVSGRLLCHRYCRYTAAQSGTKEPRSRGRGSAAGRHAKATHQSCTADSPASLTVRITVVGRLADLQRSAARSTLPGC